VPAYTTFRCRVGGTGLKMFAVRGYPINSVMKHEPGAPRAECGIRAAAREADCPGCDPVLRASIRQAAATAARAAPRQRDPFELGPGQRVPDHRHRVGGTLEEATQSPRGARP
jgi:hypothetical protein